jgi:predicted secreted protein
VSALQQKGLAISDLHWQLSDAAAKRAEAEATRRAIGALRGRVEEAAGLLDLHFVRFATVRLDTPPPFRPAMRMMAMAAPAAAAAPAPPSAAAEDIPVNATVGADAVLAPK